MMELADFAMYVAVFSAIGPQPLAVTTNLNINFLRKPTKADLLADARLMKVGKRLAVGEVTFFRKERTSRWPMLRRPIRSRRNSAQNLTFRLGKNAGDACFSCCCYPMLPTRGNEA